MLSDPAAAAWIVAGRPSIAQAPPPIEGLCGRCGDRGPTVTTTRIFSEKFTGYDAWPYGKRRLCVPCAWAYTCRRPTASLPMLITATTVTEYPDGRGLAPILSTAALPSTAAAILPVRSLRKHRYLLPTAQWGHLATDRIVVRWDSTAAERLTGMAWLRDDVGATMGQLDQPAPPAQLLTAQPADTWPHILSAWTQLQPWRENPTLWLAAREITDPT